MIHVTQRIKSNSMCFLMGIWAYIIITVFTSCEKVINVGPPRTDLAKEVVFEDAVTANSAVLSLYTHLRDGIGSGSFTSITYLTSLSSDELLLPVGNVETRQFNENELLSVNSIVGQVWQQEFQGVYLTNSIIEGLENSSKITSSLKNQLLGEAKFFRAFLYFYLVNLFGDVPFITSTDYRTNGLVTRMPVSEVYQDIIRDLLDAKVLLTDDYSYSGNERTRVNKWAATALLARVYLYQKDWVHAEEQASTIINKTSVYGLNTDLNKVFLKNSTETIWQLIPPATQRYVSEGGIFNRGYDPNIAVLTNSFVNSFEIGDDRRNKWIVSGTYQGQTWYHPLKYEETSANGTGAEYYTVFRLAEQFLIRAEARAMQNKLSGLNGADSDVNKIRNRAGLSNTSAISQAELLNAIEQERRMELFVEWGHRWLDLKRTGRANSVLSTIKAGWQPADVLYPIPYSELGLNPHMTQNNGY